MPNRFSVYYDGKCPVCVIQAEKLKATDRRFGRLTFVDCAADNFSDESAKADGKTQSALLRAIHVRRSDGAWFRGAEAIAQICLAQERKRTARLWRSPAAVLVYRCLVFLRPGLSRLGASRLARQMVRRQARRINSGR